MKTVSIGLSEKLKREGFRQDTSFYYDTVPGGSWRRILRGSEDLLVAEFEMFEESINSMATPTADEILDQLPAGYFIYKIKLKDTGEDEWLISDKAYEIETTKNWKRSRHLADAAAKMWLYLKEKGLL